MEILFITVVGYDLLDIVQSIFEKCGVKELKAPKRGMLGNFKTFKFAFAIESENVIVYRRILMEKLLAHSDLMPMYEGGDWMKIYIFKRSAFKTRLKIEDL